MLRTVTYLRLALLMPVGLGLAAPALGQQKFENLDRIDGLVATTVGAMIGEPGGALAPVDRRLHLAPCPSLPKVAGPVFGAAVVNCEALGWRIRVPLAAAAMQPSARPAMQQAREIVVHKGDPVQLVAGGASFTASRFMIADEDGAAGQMIRVREDRRSDPVVARVEETGIVRAPGFNNF